MAGRDGRTTGHFEGRGRLVDGVVVLRVKEATGRGEAFVVDVRDAEGPLVGVQSRHLEAIMLEMLDGWFLGISSGRAHSLIIAVILSVGQVVLHGAGLLLLDGSGLVDVLSGPHRVRAANDDGARFLTSWKKAIRVVAQVRLAVVGRHAQFPLAAERLGALDGKRG